MNQDRSRRSLVILLVLLVGLVVHVLLCPPSTVAVPSGTVAVAYADGSGGGPAHHRDEAPVVPPGSKLAKRIIAGQAGIVLGCLALLGFDRAVRHMCPPRSSPWTGPPSGAILLTRLCISRT